MRLLLVNNTADLYGASRCLLRLAQRLVHAGHTVCVVVPVEGPLLSELSQVGCQVVIQPKIGIIERQNIDTAWKKLRALLAIPGSTIRLIRLLLEYKPDVVHTNTSVIFGPALAAFVARIPHVWHVRETYFEYPRAWKIYRHILLFLSTKVIVISKSVLSQFDSRALYKTRLIYDGLSTAEFGGVSDERLRKFKEQYRIPDNATIGVVGRIKWHRKGQEVVVRAANLVKSRYPELRFLIVGSPFPGNEEHLKRLNQLIREYELEDRFTFTGDVRDVEAAFACMSVSVVPSIVAEPFGCVVLESMMSGLPVIGSNIGGIAEQISHGSTGLLFEPGNHAELAEAIFTLLSDNDLRNKLLANARRHVLSQYDLDESVREHIQCYTEAIEVFHSRPGTTGVSGYWLPSLPSRRQK